VVDIDAKPAEKYLGGKPYTLGNAPSLPSSTNLRPPLLVFGKREPVPGDNIPSLSLGADRAAIHSSRRLRDHRVLLLRRICAIAVATITSYKKKITGPRAS